MKIAAQFQKLVRQNPGKSRHLIIEHMAEQRIGNLSSRFGIMQALKRVGAYDYFGT